MEKGMIIKTVKRADGVQVKALHLVAISPRSLWHRVKKHGIETRALRELQKM
jgi:hypothetical protein